MAAVEGHASQNPGAGGRGSGMVHARGASRAYSSGPGRAYVSTLGGARRRPGGRRPDSGTVTKALVDQGFKNTVVDHGAHLGIEVEIVARNPADRSGLRPVRDPPCDSRTHHHRDHYVRHVALPLSRSSDPIARVLMPAESQGFEICRNLGQPPPFRPASVGQGGSGVLCGWPTGGISPRRAG